MYSIYYTKKCNEAEYKSANRISKYRAIVISQSVIYIMAVMQAIAVCITALPIDMNTPDLPDTYVVEVKDNRGIVFSGYEFQ